jgi:hypothetical protein
MAGAGVWVSVGLTGRSLLNSAGEAPMSGE